MINVLDSAGLFFRIMMNTVDGCHKCFGSNNWSKTGFTQFFKHRNQTLKKYEFGLKSVFEQVEAR